MSLVGNLEDLSLGDLLQIVSLSQKSGVLSLESSSGAGQIVFRSGLVHAAGVKGQTKDLRGLLVEAGLLEESRYDAIVGGIGQRISDLPLRIAAEAGLDGDQVDALVRKSAEGAIFTMFGWATGEFSFDALRDGESPEAYASLQRGLNAQYLAMEGMRLRDEASRAPSGAAPDPEIELSDEVFFGSDALETDVEADLDLGGDAGSAALSPVGAAAGPGTAPAPAIVDEVASQAARAAVVDVAQARAAAPIIEEVPAAQAPPSAAQASPPAAAPDAAQLARPVVVIEPDAVALEWLKSGVDGRFARVHGFQRAEQGLARIRQYLIRGDVPVVLIALTAPIDPLSGIHGLPDFVKRLRTQAPRIVVVGLREQGESKADSVPGYLDGVLTRPARQQLRSASPDETAVRPAELAHRLAEIVMKKSGGGAGDDDGAAADVDGAAPPSRSADGAQGAQGLASARSQNEVFAVLLDAAALLYARTAILLLRDQEVFAVAGRGIEALAVDPLATESRLSCLVPATGLLHRVVRDRLPVAGSVRSDADRMVAGLFGAIAPKIAYLAPIPIPGGGLAVLYADQGATRRSQPDHTALEALIEQAAGVLERIAIHRVEGEARGCDA